MLPVAIAAGGGDKEVVDDEGTFALVTRERSKRRPKEGASSESGQLRFVIARPRPP